MPTFITDRDPKLSKRMSEELPQRFLEFSNSHARLTKEEIVTDDKIQKLNMQLQLDRTNARFEENSRDILKNLKRNREEKDLLIAILESLRDPQTSQQGNTSKVIQKVSSELQPIESPAVSTSITTGSSSHQQSQVCISNMPTGKTQSEIPESPTDSMKTPEDWIMIQSNEMPLLESSVARDGSSRETVNQNDYNSLESCNLSVNAQQYNNPSGPCRNTPDPNDYKSLEAGIEDGRLPGNRADPNDYKSLEAGIEDGSGLSGNTADPNDYKSLEAGIEVGSGLSGNTADPNDYKSLESGIPDGSAQQQNKPSGSHMDAIASQLSQLNIAESNPKADAPNVSEPKPKHKKGGIFKYFKHKRKPNE